MKVQKRDIPLNAKSKVGYYYIGEIGKHKELLDGIAWRLPRLFDSIDKMDITYEYMVSSTFWKESINDYIRKELQDIERHKELKGLK